MVHVEGFSHLKLCVQNLRRSLDFYVEILGATVERQSEKHASIHWGPIEISLGEQPDRPAQTKQLGVDHVAFTVSNPEFFRAVDWLRDHHVRFNGEPVRRGAGWSLNFYDPDGTELEIHAPT